MEQRITKIQALGGSDPVENIPRQDVKREQELHEAIERVWRKYGRNLPAFQRDAEKALQKCNEQEE